MGCPWYKAVWVRKSLNKHLQRKGSIKALFISIWRIGTALIIETDPSGPHLSLPSLPKQSGALTDTQSWLKVEGCSGCVPKYVWIKKKQSHHLLVRFNLCHHSTQWFSKVTTDTSHPKVNSFSACSVCHFCGITTRMAHYPDTGFATILSKPCISYLFNIS